MRIDVNYKGGESSCFVSLKDNRVWHYEHDREVMHNLYGGEQYYTSITGLSGAGYLNPPTSENDLLEVGYYRTDAAEQRHIRVDGYRIYVPIKSHGPSEGPFVIADDNTVILSNSISCIIHYLRNWENLNGEDFIKNKTVELSWFSSDGQEFTKKVKLMADYKWAHVDIRRFLLMETEKRYGRLVTETADERCRESYFCSALKNISKRGPTFPPQQIRMGR